MQSYWDGIRGLGEVRCRILMCIGGENPGTPAYFNPPVGSSVSAAFHEHLLRLWRDADLLSAPLLAAGLVTYGRREAAEYLITHLPKERIRLDQGAGWCAAYPFQVLAMTLPVPEELSDPSRWTLGDPEGEKLMEWFAGNGERLQWDPDRSRFKVGSSKS
jgi:hypothetical protein